MGDHRVQVGEIGQQPRLRRRSRSSVSNERGPHSAPSFPACCLPPDGPVSWSRTHGGSDPSVTLSGGCHLGLGRCVAGGPIVVWGTPWIRRPPRRVRGAGLLGGGAIAEPLQVGCTRLRRMGNEPNLRRRTPRRRAPLGPGRQVVSQSPVHAGHPGDQDPVRDLDRYENWGVLTHGRDSVQAASLVSNATCGEDSVSQRRTNFPASFPSRVTASARKFSTGR